MPPRFLPLLPFLIFPLLCGCSSTNNEPPAPALPATDASTSSATSIQFDASDTITLVPSETRRLSVRVLPPSSHAVRFALLGDALDASLDSDLIQTDDTGTGSVELRGSSKAATFLVRATADDGPSAEAAVSVSSEGFASLRVIPSYSGLRQADDWTATATTSANCSQLPGIPPPDGPISATSKQSAPALLTGLPASTKLAITLRSASSLGGCLDLPPLTAGELRTVAVTISERPADISGLTMRLRASTSDSPSPLSQLVESLTLEFLDTFIPKTADEASYLLDEMAIHSPNKDEFQKVRISNNWNSTLTLFLTGDRSPRLILKSWAKDGQAELLQGAAFSANLHTNQAAAPQSVLSEVSIAGTSPGSQGLPSDAAASLYVDPGDIFHLGSSFYFLPSRLVASTIGKASFSSEGYTISPPDALREQVSCKELAKTLALQGSLPNTCDQSCVELTCAKALQKFWQRASDSSALANKLASMSFSISAHGSLNENARLIGLSGPWVGNLSIDETKLSLAGTVTLQEN